MSGNERSRDRTSSPIRPIGSINADAILRPMSAEVSKTKGISGLAIPFRATLDISFIMNFVW